MDVIKRVTELLADQMEKLARERDDREHVLLAAVEWFEFNRPDWGPGTLPTWYVDATRLLQKQERL